MVFSGRGNELCTPELIFLGLSEFDSKGIWSKTSALEPLSLGQILTVTLCPQGTIFFLFSFSVNLSEFSNMPQCLFMLVSNWFSTLLRILLEQTAESISIITKFSHLGTFSWSNEKLRLVPVVQIFIFPALKFLF